MKDWQESFSSWHCCLSANAMMHSTQIRPCQAAEICLRNSSAPQESCDLVPGRQKTFSSFKMGSILCAAIHWLVWVHVQGSGSEQDRQINLSTHRELSKTLQRGLTKRSPTVLLGNEQALLINGNGNLCMSALTPLLHSCFFHLQPTPSHSWWN